MIGRNRNEVWGRILVDELARAGVREVCVAPGSRSTPLVLALAEDERLRAFVHLDERSAAFFALGLGRATGRPAAVVTTSGTAAANLLPAVVEASWSEVPLLLLTADRPRRLRDADANQAIDQVRLFGNYPRLFLDLAAPEVEGRALRHLRVQASRAVAAALGPVAGPVHLNVPFEKPLEPDPAPRDPASHEAPRVPEDVPPGFEEEHPRAAGGRDDGTSYTRVVVGRTRLSDDEVEGVAARVRAAPRGVIVAGPHPDSGRVGPAALRLAAATGYPLLADPLSGGRFGPGGGALRVGRSDLLLRDPSVREALRPELVIRVGASPTSAAVRAFLEEAVPARQVVVDGGHRWKDHLAAATDYLRADAGDLLEALTARVGEVANAGWREAWREADGAADGTVAKALEGALFEGTVLAEAARAVPGGGALFVSSSMPVRDLDAFGASREEAVRVHGNRGASGIDGIVSSALGVAAGSAGPTVAVLGDVALIHDMNGLLAARKQELDAVLVVIHNDGGGIFHMLPIREHEPAFTPYFATPHGLDFRHAAALYGLPFIRAESREELRTALAAGLAEGGCRIVEVRTDREENRKRHEAVAEAVAGAARKVLGV